MNKIDIIQKLLDERHITAKEALVLMQTEKEYVYYPYPQYPIYKHIEPIGPIWCGDTNDFTITSYQSNN
jgi:hypothetical protein